MKISYYNIGCKVNYAEISSIVQTFLDNGAELVPFGEDCDLVLINSCTVTHLADSDSRKIIRRAKRKAPNARIAAMGCYAQMQADKIAEIEGVDYIFGNKEKFEIFDLIQNDLNNNFQTKNNEVQTFVSNLSNSPFFPAFSSDNESHSRVVFKIQDGCDYHCAYCTVAAARGPSRSMSFDEIEKTIRTIEAKGYKEIVLSGINLGDYRTAEGKRFIDLLRMIEAANFDARFRISSIEPNLLTEEIMELVSNSKKICPHFHIPLQSGSDRVLKKMRRRYSKSLFENRVELIKKDIPDCCIGVDIICGFPTETEEDFEETFALLKMLPISYLHIFTYSERAGTDAIKLKPKVPYEEKKRRTLRLRELSEIKKTEFYKSQLGKLRKVILEDFDERNNFYKGWTENYVRVKFFCEKEIESQIVSVKLDSLKGDLVFGEIANFNEC